MVLVDSTVWIDFLRQNLSPPVRRLRRLLQRNEAAITPVIFQELLQGAASPEHLQRLRDSFAALPRLMPSTDLSTYAAAAELYARCRRRGLTPRSPHACLIAQTAIEHGVRLLHDDRDFVAIARVDTRLKLLPVRT